MHPAAVRYTHALMASGSCSASLTRTMGGAAARPGLLGRVNRLVLWAYPSPEIQLRRFKHFLGSKYLRSLESTPEGRHYSGIGDAGTPAVIFGDGWAGSSSLSFFSNRLSSGSGSV